MLKLFRVFLITLALITPAVAADYSGPVTSAGVQSAIDALPLAGGEINLPCGTFSGDILELRDNVVLDGQGPCTIIPRLEGDGSSRNYGFGLRDLIVDGGITTTAGYCIDWRNVTNGHIRNVISRGCTYGLLLAYSAFYNRIEGLFASASVVAVEVYGGANQNTFIGGKFSAPTGFVVNGANGTTIVGTALESDQNNMVFKSISNDDGATRAVGVRQEDANHSSTYWNQ